nr:MAG TPA: hypothetical protein [Bacteriophage sp.]
MQRWSSGLDKGLQNLLQWFNSTPLLQIKIVILFIYSKKSVLKYRLFF